MGAQRKIRVAVVFGGRSGEHAVSCASAGLFLGAIDRDKYEVVPIGIARDGRWVLTSGDVSRLALTAGELPSVEAVATPGVSVTPQAGPGGGSLVFSGPAAVPADLGEVDVVVPLLHGTYGEDGTIQGLLEMTGVKYAGAGVFASAAGMDKEYMKILFAARGLPIGPYVVVRAGLAGIRQARPRGVVDRAVTGRRSRRARDGDRGGAAVRPQGASRGGDRRGR